MISKLTRFLKEVGAILNELWNTAQDVGYCCGIRLDPPSCSEYMPTASSCCGVRA